MKAISLSALQMGLWSVWLSGILLIGLSLYATHRLPPLTDLIIKQPKFNDPTAGNPKVTIFSGPRPFTDSVGHMRGLAIRTWLALSPDITVVLFSQDPSVHSFAASFGSRVLVESHVDFTFLGTPFFHSMVARSCAFATDISVFVDSETILLPDFIPTMNYAHKLNHDWLLVASPRNVSYFPFNLDDAGKHWVREDGKRLRIKELQEMLGHSYQWNFCEGRIILAWNHGDLPLHNGVLPPFLYGKGIHDLWVINEALSSGFRFVFDASETISSFYLVDPEHRSDQSVRETNVSDIQHRKWEYVGNSHLGPLYGTSYFHDVISSGMVKLLKCGGQYLFVNRTESFAHPFIYQRSSLRTQGIPNSLLNKKIMACYNEIKSLHGTSLCSLKDQLKLSTPLNLPLSLESLLSVIADKNKTIVLAVAGYSYKDMLMSWVCRLRSLHVTNFVVCALDHDTYQFSVLQGLPVFGDSSAPSNISFDDCHFGTDCFQRVTKVKSRMVLTILKLGYNVLLSDVDVYWFKNPLSLLSSFGPDVLAAQSDEYKETGPINLPRRLNSGFYFAHSDGSTISAMEKVVKHAAISGLSEQPSFYDTLCGEGGSNRISDNRCVEPETNLTIYFLDRNLFPNGAYLGLWEEKNVKATCVKKGCLILHNNWVSGRMKKLERQVMSGLWEYDSSTRMCLQSWHSAGTRRPNRRVSL
ncbi:Nucleotid_trans domain-containing protein [Cephalotus follicularis]|uniref:Nucleotid_trans domain-containing protein n=1 Tax=Cephalotus follicularis TaxID=3775 RepID=A0A1Q3DFD4_CEPFO|nr:Nucleotid_trans domain-containing protein [Cephalotus follicularis]